MSDFELRVSAPEIIDPFVENPILAGELRGVMREFVKVYGNPNRVFYPGCGADNWPSILFPDAKVTYCDPADVIGRKKAHFGDSQPNTTWIQGRAEDQRPQDKHNMVISQCSQAGKLAEIKDLKEGGFLFQSETYSGAAFDQTSWLELVGVVVLDGHGDDGHGDIPANNFGELRLITSDVEKYMLDYPNPILPYWGTAKVHPAEWYVFQKKDPRPELVKKYQRHTGILKLPENILGEGSASAERIYTVLDPNLEPKLKGFMGYVDGHLFISNDVPEKYIDPQLIHEVLENEHSKYKSVKDRCVRVSELELSLIPDQKQREYAEYRSNFFTNLITYYSSLLLSQSDPETKQKLEESIQRFKESKTFFAEKARAVRGNVFDEAVS